MGQRLGGFGSTCKSLQVITRHLGSNAAYINPHTSVCPKIFASLPFTTDLEGTKT